MTKAQEQELENLLKRYEDIFAKDEYDLGRTDIVKHEIDTGDCKPIKQAAYKVNPHKKKIIEDEVKKMSLVITNYFSTKTEWKMEILYRL